MIHSNNAVCVDTFFKQTCELLCVRFVTKFLLRIMPNGMSACPLAFQLHKLESWAMNNSVLWAFWIAQSGHNSRPSASDPHKIVYGFLTVFSCPIHLSCMNYSSVRFSNILSFILAFSLATIKGGHPHTYIHIWICACYVRVCIYTFMPQN
jgi:hypothetical protein